MSGRLAAGGLSETSLGTRKRDLQKIPGVGQIQTHMEISKKFTDGKLVKMLDI